MHGWVGVGGGVNPSDEDGVFACVLLRAVQAICERV